MTEKTFKPPTCPSCGASLNRVEINETLTGIFDPKTGKYREDGELETKCLECSADLYEVFQDGPCNFQSEEEHKQTPLEANISYISACAKAQDQQPAAEEHKQPQRFDWPHKPKRVKPQRLQMHKHQEGA